LIATRSCQPIDNDERVRQYDDRVRKQPGFHPREYAWRIAAGVRDKGEIIRFPIPRHRALVVIE
jgi:hypothetical protein